MGIPQISIIILLSIGLISSFFQHRNKVEVNFWVSLLVWSTIILILTSGGFFD